jgi:uncharacterized protein (TIGR03790 family)
MRRFFLIAAACVGALAGSLRAEPGDEVVVIYNTRMPESKVVADYYAQRRHVPERQVYGFPLSTNDDFSRAEFRESLQKPLADKLRLQKLWQIGMTAVPATTNHPARIEWKPLWSKIRYAVLCYGVPLRVARDPFLKEEGMEKLRPEMRRDEAAVDNELAWLPCIEERPPLFGPLHNPFYTTTNAFSLHPTNGILLVTRLDGPSPEIARGLVDKALQAERYGLWGRAYFDIRNITDPAYKLGDDWIRGAADLCRRLGFETVVDENPGTFPIGFPMSHIAFYAGWYDGNVSGPFTLPKVEFMPGAFAYHLHSYSAANLHSASQNWAGPLLAKGATATMGSVAEPYLSGTPDVAVFTARWIYSRFTFGEAAYACQSSLSWQTTVVGDPLYRPFGTEPDRQHLELMAQHNQLVEWSWLRLANLNTAVGRPLSEVIALLESVDLTRHSAVLSEKLADLYAAQGKPSSAIHEYKQALTLDPSPQQRVRLLLTLGEKQLAQGDSPGAYEAYQQLLRDCPDYPDKLSLYKKLFPLAVKLGKKEEADNYEAEIARLTPPPPPPPDEKAGKAPALDQHK